MKLQGIPVRREATQAAVAGPLAAAFVFMLALVLAANLFADAVRDAFDPRTVDPNV